MKIALLGSIPKGDDIRKGWTDWKEDYKQLIQKAVPDAQFVDGDALSDNAGPEMVVGHDLATIQHADLCIVDGQSKIGAGTAQEIVIAKYFKKPVVIVIPRDSHHRKSNVTFHGVTLTEWIHPFLYISTDYIAESVTDAADWVARYASREKHSQPIKDFSIFEHVIERYEKSQHNLVSENV
jgi:hypothetical protein